MGLKKIRPSDEGDNELPTIKNKSTKDKKKKRQQNEDIDELGYVGKGSDTPAKLKQNLQFDDDPQ